MSEDPDRPEHPQGSQTLHAVRERLADLGVETVFRIAEQCKPDSLVADGLTFDDVLGWKDPRRKVVLWKRDIHPDRRARFANHRFTLVSIPMTELRLWPRAGGLPAEWTDQLSIAKLGEMLRSRVINVPNNANRLRRLLEFATTPHNLEQIRTIPAIALPEFHEQCRTATDATPWTLDDGSHRALVLAAHGDTDLWCLAGFKRQPPHDELDDGLLTSLAGANTDDRNALRAYLTQPDGRRRLDASMTIHDRSVLALGHLPDLPIWPVNTREVLLQRVEVRRAHAVSARNAGIFRPTDDRGRTLAGLVAEAEFVRTKGAAAFVTDRRTVAQHKPQHANRSEQDAAISAAGEIALAALDVGGVSSRESAQNTRLAYPAVLDLVRQLAAGRQLHPDDDIVHAIIDGAPARLALTHASDQDGAGPWLGRQLARACIVAADAAQVDANWDLVQYHATRSLAAVLRHTEAPTRTTAVEDLMILVRGLNRLGVSHRARWREGLWRVEKAELHHEAAIELLSWCAEPSGRARSGYVLNWFTTLTNLASAWNEKTTAATTFGLDVDDLGYRRAAGLLRALYDMDRDSAHAAMHGIDGVKRECNRDRLLSLTCLPDYALVSLKGKSNYRPWWTWVLLNDLAQMLWCAGIHAINGGRESSWCPPGRIRPASPVECIREGLLNHIRAIKDLSSAMQMTSDDDLNAARMRYWRWQHLKNLRRKRDQLVRDGDDVSINVLSITEISEGLHYLNAVSDEFPARQLATLDAYHEKDHEVTLWPPNHH